MNLNRLFLSAAFFGVLACGNGLTRADGADVPGGGFAASRYEKLWTKSPFAVATPEAAQSSPDYKLVGIAQFDGVSYASLIDNQSQQHFLLTSDKPANGLTLTSITRGRGASGNQAIVQKNGQSISLRQDDASSSGPGFGPGPVALGGPMNTLPAPQPVMTQPLPMPGAGNSPGGIAPGVPPFPRRRFPLIRLPPNPAQQQQQQPPGAPPTAPVPPTSPMAQPTTP